VLYTLRIFEKNKGVTFIEKENGVSIGSSDSFDIRLSEEFISNYIQKRFSFNQNLNDKGFVELSNGTPDYLSTAFYMLSCIQELDPLVPPDTIGRFQYKNSYQSKLNLASQNIVQFCFDKLGAQFNLPNHSIPTRFFLSHDIDTVYESILQDGFYALKSGRFDIFFRLLFNVAMGNPDWLNMDQIMALESEYDCQSTFFWIAKKGKEGLLKNADYNFTSPRIQRITETVGKKGFENGIHKSISASSFHDELSSFQTTPIANRYHYLKFKLPEGFDAIEQANLKIDASLGFAENIGFRNSYGLPFTPYNVHKRIPYSFVEIPLHVMDTTLYKYNKSSVQEAERIIFEFFNANRANTVISVLWHNNFFSNYKYKGYLPLYKKILAYLRENNFKTISQKEIVEKYTITWP
jgi:peptidoglycan/xylan/chitin deacetylase (PgdA/CDA1 family)